MKNTPQECAKTSAFTFGACHFRLVHFGSAGATRIFPLTLGFCKDYFVINDFEKQLISVVKIQCIPHPFCNMDLPIIMSGDWKAPIEADYKTRKGEKN